MRESQGIFRDRLAAFAARCGRKTAKGHGNPGNEEGATLVEMALASILMLAMLFGIIEISIALYSYHFVSEAAREVTRYAVVRGSNSCVSSLNAMQPCNIGPTSSGNLLQTYAQSLGYSGIMPGNITVTATWWVASINSTSLTTQWVTQCTTLNDSLGNPCNNPGNQVQVVVQYAFPLNIPFWRATTLTVRSNSSGVIMN